MPRERSSDFTPGELRVLRAVYTEDTTNAVLIAKALGLSRSVVNTHLASILRKGKGDLREIARKAKRDGKL